MDASQLNCLARAHKIGMFDSGLGGLSVLSSFSQAKELNHIDYLYIGDSNRCPYGNRPYGQIKEFVDELADWLLREGADAIVMACNTSAALVADELKIKCNVPVVELLSPLANYVAKQNFKRVGIIATHTTAKSKAFSKAILSESDSIEVFELGCPDLVPLVEKGLTDTTLAQDKLHPYIKELVSKDVDAIVFGCTHYPFLARALEKTVKSLTEKHIAQIDPAKVLTDKIALFSADLNQTHNKTKARSIELVTTGDANQFRKEAALLLGQSSSNLNVRSVKLPVRVNSITQELTQNPVITSISPA